MAMHGLASLAAAGALVGAWGLSDIDSVFTNVDKPV